MMDNTNDNSSRHLEWEGDDYLLQSDTHDEISCCLLDEDSQNEENLFCLFSETTPVKGCMDFDCNFYDIGENMPKEVIECRQSSQSKRRRMLQFNSGTDDPFICDEEMPSVFTNSEVGDSFFAEDQMHENMQWVSGFSEDRCIFSNESFGQSSDSWVEDFLIENDMQFNSGDIRNIPGASDDQVSFSESCNAPSKMEANAKQQPAPPPSRSLFKVKSGKRTFMRSPTKLVASVAYPFALIKPCGAQGDVTLKDINQRIHTPAASKLKHTEEDPLSSYPTSAFSGKPVVLKTKIRTEGGKGSITIMRTKG